MLLMPARGWNCWWKLCLHPTSWLIWEISSPAEEQEALIWLDDRNGRETWDHFTRQFGEIREMGAGRLDRERPDLAPISPVEGLWYRALIARGFFESESGLLEFAYIPDDIRDFALPFLNPDRKETTAKYLPVPQGSVQRNQGTPAGIYGYPGPCLHHFGRTADGAKTRWNICLM